jgi:DNA-directed RNA polymerase II subunit RPB2
MEEITWKILDKYFKENTHNLVAHHLDSYNDFFATGLHNILRENNPLRFIERNSDNDSVKDKTSPKNQILLYIGGKEGNKVYFGKPIIYDDNYSHYMYPNDARLRNMTYGFSIHYDVDVEIITYDEEEKKTIRNSELQKIYLGNFPIMLQSNLCILNKLHKEVRFNMGECRNDYGGYFIINGKEKSIICQEKFADNMLYIQKHKEDNIYSFTADVRSVSDDASKPIRTSSVRIVAPSTALTNNQIVVNVPNVRKPVPLFILMRALGVISDKSIIEHCLLDLDANSAYVDLFIPSVHDAFKIFDQQMAIEYIASFTQKQTITGALDILMNYFLPHIGSDNFLEKAYYVGYMVNKLLKVFTGDNPPTDRDNFKYKRIELTGTLIYELFREYYIIQKKNIEQLIDKEYYYHSGKYAPDLSRLIEDNYVMFFKERIVENGFKKGFKGNWGADAHTKRIGVIQDLNRLSWLAFMNQLRKFNLPFPSNAKIVQPRKLNSSQWGYIDPVDTPDGENIGFHKHMSCMCTVSNNYPYTNILKWLLASNMSIILLSSCSPKSMSTMTKILINGRLIGVTDVPFIIVDAIKLNRRNGLLPIYTSVSYSYEMDEIFIYTDAGRLCRPIYYIENGHVSINKSHIELINKSEFTWEQLITGFLPKKDTNYNIKSNKVYDMTELYSVKKDDAMLQKNSAIIDYVDVSEEERLLIATTLEDLPKNKYYTNLEIHPSFIMGFLGNLIIYPEHNPLPRNSFSCGQSRQAVSMYHSNYQMRMDKMGVVMNYGQVPLVKSRYLKYLNNEEMPYGVNAIVAIMSYTGYNVEDAILINKSAIERGLFRTTYYTTYSDKEESSKVKGSTTNTKFSNIEKLKMSNLKIGYTYSLLDDYGLVKEGTLIDDRIIVIGKVTADSANSDIHQDESVTTKKGQLGYVDKSFITEGEEGFRVAKVRVCEERIPAIGDKMACALPTQQVLTNVGWIEIKDVDIDTHMLATLDKNGNMCYEHPINKFEYDHCGKMYSVKNKQVELVCTLNHKLYVKKREVRKGDKQYELIEAKDVMGKMVRFKKNMTNVYPDIEYITLDDKQYKMDHWLQLLGMFISDGSTNSGAVYISALKQRKIDFNTSILTNLNVKFTYDNVHDKFCILKGKHLEIYEELDKYSVGALNKYLPEYVWSLSQRQSNILMDALMQGDGHTYSDGFSRYGTISPRLANDISRLAVHCGNSGIIKIASEPDGTGHLVRNSGKDKESFHMIISKHTYYKISIITKQNEPFINKKVNDSNVEELIDYEGKVYCVEMPSSNLYYMRENNLAPCMLIGNSRSGQKGTVGLVIPEKDMPFTADGLKPDLIINPHALPSRMTIGQLIECLLGNACVHYGGYGNSTPFAMKGSNTEMYGQVLSNAGLNSKGLKILYDGMSGNQMESEIFIGPTYYMRLKHMVKDKINYRATGPRTMLTKQTVQGRANDGGMRIGEMERDGILAHGASAFLNESYLKRGDEYYMAVCNKSGGIAIYNKNANLFLSPYADGPIQFNTNVDGTMNVENISKFGRSFSIVKVPYSLKLMIQELQAMNVQMRIITEDNIDQLMSMSYSSNIKTLLKDKNKDIADTIKNYKMNMDMKLSKASPVSSSPVSSSPVSSSILSPASPVLLPSSSSYSLPPISIPEEVEYVPSATQLEEIQQDNNMLTNSLITPYSSSKGVNELKDNLSLFLSPEEIKSITTDKKIKKSKWTSMSKPQQDSVKQYINTMKTDILEVPPELSEEEKEREEEGQKSSGSTKKITITSENN